MQQFQEKLKVLVKNTKEESRKCKTIIQIDGEQVFISDDYQWEHLDNPWTEFEVYAGCDYFNKGLKASIKNITIISYE